MDDKERQRFREVAAECTQAMIGLAYLITGSQPGAERALRRALSTTARQWRVAQVAPERYILSTLCQDQVGWRHRWTRSGLDDAPSVTSHGDEEDSDPDWYGLHSAMRKAIRSLPRAERVVIALQQYEDLTAEETAQVLGWSDEQVRHRTERARARLRDLLAEMSAPEDALGHQSDSAHPSAAAISSAQPGHTPQAGHSPGSGHVSEGTSA